MKNKQFDIYVADMTDVKYLLKELITEIRLLRKGKKCLERNIG